MTKQFAYLKQRDTIHHEPTGKGMTKIMDVEVVDPSTPTGRLKRFLNIFDILNYN